MDMTTPEMQSASDIIFDAAISKAIEDDRELLSPSIQHFLRGGKVNGEFGIAIKRLMRWVEKKTIESASSAMREYGELKQSTRLRELLERAFDAGDRFGYGNHPDKETFINSILSESPQAKQSPRWVKIEEALRELVHLHNCEQEGISSGQPTPQMWFNAVNKAVEALDESESPKEG